MRFYRLFASFGETQPAARAPAISACSTARPWRRCARCGERARFSKGLYAWIGFRSDRRALRGGRSARSAQSKFSYRKLFRFALDGITSFSTLPLKVWTYVGTIISICALATAVFFIFRTHASTAPTCRATPR